MITQDTIRRGIERAQGRGRQVPSCFLANDISITSRMPVVHVNLPQAPLPENYAAPIMHRHDFPPQAPSRTAHMPEYSNSAVVGYSDDHRSPSPRCCNTRRCQYTNSPKYD